MTEQMDDTQKSELAILLRGFHDDGFFQSQFSHEHHEKRWQEWRYDEARCWGGFARE